jgi:hypothetical protein
MGKKKRVEEIAADEDDARTHRPGRNWRASVCPVAPFPGPVLFFSRALISFAIAPFLLLVLPVPVVVTGDSSACHRRIASRALRGRC